MIQPLFVGDARPERRRIPIWLVLDSDNKSPATAETGGQPKVSINGGTAVNTTNTLVAIDTATGLYYIELTQSELAGLRPLDWVVVTYKSSNTAAQAALRGVDVLPFVDEGTAQAGAVGSITLQSGASATPSAYVGMFVWIYAGTGKDQVREISAYNGTTKVATPTTNFLTAPDGTSRYLVLFAAPSADVPTAVWAAQVAGLTAAGSVGNQIRTSLDVAVSTRLASAEYLAPDNDNITAAAQAAQAALTSADSALAQATTAATQATAAATAAQSVDTKLTTARAANLDKVDVTVSSRSSHSAADVVTAMEGPATKLSGLRADYTTARAARIDNVDVAVSTRLATSGYTAPDNAGVAALSTALTALRTDYTTARATNLDRLDAAISTRLATSGYTAPDNAGVAALRADYTTARAAKLDLVDVTVSSRLAGATYVAPNNADIATAAAQATTAATQATQAATSAASVDGKVTTQRAANLDRIDANVSSAGTAASAAVGPAVTAALASGVALTGTERTALVNAILGAAVEADTTVKNALQLIAATVAGQVSGATAEAGQATVQVTNPSGTATRVSALTDENGNRISVTTNFAG
jgi:hypothetical protein